jgi:hypothetical protein
MYICAVRSLAAIAAFTFAAAASAQVSLPYEVTLDFDLLPGVEITDAVVAEIDDFGVNTLINSFTFNGSGSVLVDSNADPVPVRLGALGRYTYAENSVLTEDGVAVFMSNGIAPEVVGSSWDDVFPGFAEDLIAQSLLDIQNNEDQPAQQAAVNTLFSFFSAFPTYFPMASPNTGSWVGFSEARIYGSGAWQANPVPEPGLLIAAAAGAALLRRRRRA